MLKHEKRSRRLSTRRSLVTAASLVLAAGAISAAPGFQGWWPASHAVGAVTVNPVAPARGFNAISEGDTYLSGTESEGPIAVGGDLSFGSQYRVRIHEEGTVQGAGETNPVALLVRGGLDFAASGPTAELSVPTSGYVKIGSLDNAEVHTTDPNGAQVNTRITPEGTGYDGTPRVQLSTQQPAASVGADTGLIDFDQAFADFRSYSSGLSACVTTVRLTDANGDVEYAPNDIPSGADVHVHLTPGEQNVLNITGETFNSLAQLTFDDPPTADTPLIINVDTSGTGGVFTWEGPTPAGASGATAPYTLWNFSGATAVTIPQGVDTVEGTVYAPDADVAHYSAANIEGTVVAATFTQDLGGSPAAMRLLELHYHPFDTEVTTCDAVGGPTPTPSPTESPSPEPSPTPSPSPEPSPTPSPTYPYYRR
ncbi:choice-of-anchor A family protein [Nocardiopsis sp. FIRDI 009]|uniref:choice-of-anchor A family protein n=1 Tax=Nocardiopsis sp. FIRDI 009 TaxID=714197 RepID=UPI0018E542AA|nr:choice-of-anchor A family protein [Nocardiopsis sp. FIRDI 009]